MRIIQTTSLNRPTYNVGTTALLTDTGVTLNDRRALLNLETNSVIGIVSNRYSVVQNAEMYGAVDSAFAEFGLTPTSERHHVVRGGSRIFSEFNFRETTRKLAVGDTVGLRVTMQNSFDGSRLAQLSCGSLRLICLNGAVSLEHATGLSYRHNGAELDIDSVRRAMANSIGQFDKTIEVYNRLAEVEISQDNGSALITRFERSNIMAERVANRVRNVWAKPTYKEDSDRNLWNLYNAVTQVATHDISAKRFELSTNIARRTLGALNDWAQNPQALAEAVVLN